MSTVYTEPARVHDLILWEEGMAAGEQRYTRKLVNFVNTSAATAAVQASGTLTLTSPAATIALSAQAGGVYDGEAGNLGAITVDVVDGVSEGVSYAADTKVMTITVDISGAAHNTVNALNTVLNASAGWASSVTLGGASAITGSTAGSATLANGQDAVAVAAAIHVGCPLAKGVSDYYPVSQGNENDAVAVLLCEITGLVEDEAVSNVPILMAGPAIINIDALQPASQYVDVDGVMTVFESLTPYSIDRVNEPVQQTSGVED